jgi:putative ABC transport system permease protein
MGLLVVFFFGMLGPIAIQTLNVTVQSLVGLRSQELQTSDYTISAFRELRRDEIAILNEIVVPTKSAREIEMMAMSTSAREGADKNQSPVLIELHAVDRSYPLYGSFRFSGDRRETNSEKLFALTTENSAFVAPEVLAQLGIAVGEFIQVGRAKFRVIEELSEAPGLSRFGPGTAPKVYIKIDDFQKTGLNTIGTLASHRRHLGVDNSIEKSFEKKAEELRNRLTDPDLSLRMPGDAGATIEQFTRFFRIFLVTFISVSTILAWQSAASVVRHFISSRASQFATLITLGAGRSRALSLVIVPVFASFLLALVSAISVNFVVVLSLNHFGAKLLPSGFLLIFSMQDAATAAAFALLVFSVIGLLPLYPLAITPLRSLLGSSILPMADRRQQQVSAIFAGLILFILGYVLLGLWREISLLCLILVVYSFFAIVIYRGILKIILRRASGSLKVVATQVSRQRGALQLLVFAFLVTGLLLHLSSQLIYSVRFELRPRGQLPDFFLFNVAESGLKALEEFQLQTNYRLENVAPLILARYRSLDGRDLRQEKIARFPVRLTYRSQLLPSEAIVDGKWFSDSGRFENSQVSDRIDKVDISQKSNEAASSDRPERSAQEAELSVEVRYAERSGIRLGSQIEFDVQGVPLKGRVTSLRRVRWTEFNPNFFIVVQAGGWLEDAPKSLLANLSLRAPDSDQAPGTAVSSAGAPATGEARVRFQSDFVRAFSEISLIDIKLLLSRLSQLTQDALKAVLSAAGISLFLSMVSMFVLVAHNLSLRSNELRIHRLLGTRWRRLFGLWFSEYLLVLLLCLAISSILGLLVAKLISGFVFDLPFFPNLSLLLAVNGVISLCVAALVSILISKNLRKRGWADS